MEFQEAFQDAANYSADFKVADNRVIEPSRDPSDPDFIEQLFSEYSMEEVDRKALQEYIDKTALKIVGERFIRLISFCHKCGLPSALVFWTLCTEGEMSMVEIAEKCGISKQAVHKRFRKMELEFKKYGEGFERRRQFKNPKTNERNHD